MLICHLSDIHLFSVTSDSALIRPDIADTLQHIVADIAAFTPAVDVVALTGDLTEGGTHADYALLRKLLAPLSTRIVAIPGNHDLRANFRAAFQDILPFDDDTLAHYEVVHGGTRFLALDTVVEGRSEGGLGPQHLDWIGRKLAASCPGPTTILMHHPPNTSGLAFFDSISLIEGREEFGRLVAGYCGRLNILCGHIHRPTQAMWNGAFVAVAGSPAFQTDLDLRGQIIEPTLVDIPYAYFIYNSQENGNFAVHPRFVSLPDQRSTIG